MRKRTLNRLFDKVLYGVFLIAPFVMLGIFAWHNNIIDIHSYILNLGGYMQGTILYDAINDSIGVNGIVPFVNANTAWMVEWLVYAATVSVMHLLLDCVLFFPHVVRKVMYSFGGEDDE